MNEKYSDPEYGLTGRDKFFGKLKEEYLGITKRMVGTFLNNLETNQVHADRPNKVVPRGIRLKKPLQRWDIDLVMLKGDVIVRQ